MWLNFVIYEVSVVLIYFEYSIRNLLSVNTNIANLHQVIATTLLYNHIISA